MFPSIKAETEKIAQIDIFFVKEQEIKTRSGAKRSFTEM